MFDTLPYCGFQASKPSMTTATDRLDRVFFLGAKTLACTLMTGADTKG